MSSLSVINIIIYSGLTILCYQFFAWIQKKSKSIYLNPMLLSVLVIIAILSYFDISYVTYQEHSALLSNLLTPAVVALGYPLYQHLDTVKQQWKKILCYLTIAAIFVVTLSYLLTMLIIGDHSVAVSLSLKSITTPIGLALTEQLAGNAAITAFTIIIAGLVGATIGMKWLTFIKVTSPHAQGLAIGTASHALGTATISGISFKHAAYSSFALIVSATVTAIISPIIIPLLKLFF